MNSRTLTECCPDIARQVGRLRRTGFLIVGKLRGAKMKCALLALFFLIEASHVLLAVESRGARSCSEWQKYRQDKIRGYSMNADIYETWLVGYLSGIVAGTGEDFLAGTDNETVFRMVDDYCDENLQMNLATAGTSAARQLVKQKGIINQPTLP